MTWQVKLNLIAAGFVLVMTGCAPGTSAKEKTTNHLVQAVDQEKVGFPQGPAAREASGAPVSRIETGFLLGKANWDDDDEADGLTVTLMVLSADNRSVQAEGEVYFRLYEQDLSQLDKKGKALLGWHIPADKLGDFWKNGLFGGYYFLLDYGAKPPRAEYGLLESCLKASDGSLSFTRDTSVKLK
jgi:hypothetical protein